MLNASLPNYSSVGLIYNYQVLQCASNAGMRGGHCGHFITADEQGLQCLQTLGMRLVPFKYSSSAL